MSEAQTERTVEIVDDHFLFAQALGSVVGEQPGWSVAGIAVTGPQALGIAKERQPDVVLLDYHLPGVNADTLIPRLRSLAPGAKIIILTSDTSDATRSTALAAGADGFMTKETAIEDVIDEMAGVLVGRSRSAAPAPAERGVEPAFTIPAPLAVVPAPRSFAAAGAAAPSSSGGSLVRVAGATFARLAALERRLEAQPGVRAAWVRAFDEGGAELRVVHDGGTGELDRAVAQAADGLAIARR